MIKIIIHIAKAAIAVVLFLLCLSCGFDIKSVDGNGNVANQKRTVEGSFHSVSASGDLEVIIEQGAQPSVTVEADENLQEHIKTEVKGKELVISSDANIGSGERTITVVLPNVESLSSASKAVIRTKNRINSESMTFSSSSGASIEANAEGRNIRCEASSGARITIEGITENLEIKSSNGSNINAKNLKADSVKADASSGGHTTVNPTRKLTADAKSGGKVYYVNTPSQLKKEARSGGTVSQL